jgi:general secretion pathway protein F
MELIIGIVLVNIVFLGLLLLTYLVVTRRRLKISLLVEHLATLAKYGLPIHAGLRVIGRDLGGYLGSRLSRAAQQMEEGKSLGEAFAGSPGTFPSLLRSMLALGEKSGNLSGFLDEMRRSYRRIADLPFQSMYLFLYPMLLSIGINLAMSGLMVGIVPRFKTILQQMSLDSSVHDTWWPRLMFANEVILVFCVAFTAFFVLGGTSIHFGTSFFRRLKAVVDRVILALPVVGRMVRDGAVQQFSLCAGLFLRSGAGLPEALRAAAEVERNGILRRRLEHVARAVSEGTRLSAAIRAEGGFGDDLLWFVDTGETSGLLSDHLLLAAVHYETKVRLLGRLASRGVVPFFVVLNGIIVGGSFFLIFHPMRETLQSMLHRRPF